jgi:hypothetical protein
MPYIALDPALATPVLAPTLGAPRTTGAMTFLQLETDLGVMLGNRSEATSPRRRSWVNQAYTQVAAMVELPELHGNVTFTTVVDSALYLLPSSVRVLQTLIHVDSTNPAGGSLLQPVSLTNFHRLAEDTGAPTRYYRLGQLLALWRTPSTALDLHATVLVRPQLLTLDADVPMLPDEWHRAILLKAKAVALSDLRDVAAAMTAENDFARTVSSMLNPAALETSTGYGGFVFMKEPPGSLNG